MHKKLFYMVYASIFIVFIFPFSYAGMGSNTYNIPTSVMSVGGGPMSSGSYQADVTLGQSSPLMDSYNPPTSPNYELYPGFWYTLDAMLIQLTCECDISGDGTITPQDALCAFEKYLGICPTTCGVCAEICCDVSGDEMCTPADALCVFQEYLGIGCEDCGSN